MTLTDFLVHEAKAARAETRREGAAVGAPGPVRYTPPLLPGVIVKLTRAFDVWRWLCPRHIELARLKGWALKERREPPHALPCEECA